MFCFSVQISYEEGVQLNSAFKSKTLSQISPFSSSLTSKGKAVLASLFHWCGHALKVPAPGDNKCFVKGCPYYLQSSLLSGSGSDASLKAALVSTRDCAATKGLSAYVVTRLNQEIQFLP
jgi:hypothetical protein